MCCVGLCSMIVAIEGYGAVLPDYLANYFLTKQTKDYYQITITIRQLTM